MGKAFWQAIKKPVSTLCVIPFSGRIREKKLKSVADPHRIA
jgi:hypothetical protein